MASSSMATPLGLLSQRDQRLSLAELAHGLQIPLAEARTDLGGLTERRYALAASPPSRSCSAAGTSR
jgi:DNA-binding IclR family transcriptional regulator